MGKKLTALINDVTADKKKATGHWDDVVLNNDIVRELGAIFGKKLADYRKETGTKKDKLQKEITKIVAELKKRVNLRGKAMKSFLVARKDFGKSVEKLRIHINKRNNRNEGWRSKKHTKDAEILLSSAKFDEDSFYDRESKIRLIRLVKV
ncbi:hypothetical protein [Leisingera sp. ANG-Vp]|uniref:hypothetical protein n=1 Tax=Leisingera sp. ANG-Vp TaxID=1577896 RepID=UPI00057EC84B|nr:hypothetical protein [Leisingera sp. ANG-Vp]KIC22496.1 hypothetical protein RA20_01035 [Leisingera sp. ANG-Vp]